MYRTRGGLAVCALIFLTATAGCQKKAAAPGSPSPNGAAGGGVYVGAPGAGASLNSQSPAPQSGPFAAGYQAVDANAVACGFEDVNYISTVNGDYTVPVGGQVGKFYCSKPGSSKKYISLARDTFKDGFISTKDYGDIQILFANNINSAGFIIGMKPAYYAKLTAWLLEK